MPRRVADRSVAMRPSASSWAWLWVLLAVLGGAGGAFYYYKARGLRAGRQSLPTGDTRFPGNAGYAPVAPPAPSAAPRLRRAAADTTSSGARLVACRADAGTDRSGRAPPDVVGPVDSGGIRLVGLPRGSTVLIDEKPITQALTRLAPGPHALAISAPRYNFYSDTIVIRPGQIQELTPQLTQLGAPGPGRTLAPTAPTPAAPRAQGTTPMAPASTSAPSRSTRRS